MQILLINAVIIFARAIEYLILARIIISWLPIDRSNPIIQLLYLLTEPILGPIRKLMYKSPLGGAGMMIDFSPVIAGLLVHAVMMLAIQIIVGF